MNRPPPTRKPYHLKPLGTASVASTHLKPLPKQQGKRHEQGPIAKAKAPVKQPKSSLGRAPPSVPLAPATKTELAIAALVKDGAPNTALALTIAALCVECPAPTKHSAHPSPAPKNYCVHPSTTDETLSDTRFEVLKYGGSDLWYYNTVCTTCKKVLAKCYDNDHGVSRTILDREWAKRNNVKEWSL